VISSFACDWISACIAVTSSSRRSSASTAAQPRHGILDLEDLLGILEPELQVRRDEIREPAGLLHVRRDREHLGRQVLQREQLLDARAHCAHHRLDLHRPRRLEVVRHRLDPRPRRGVAFLEVLDAHAREALHEHLHAAVRQPHRAHHHRDGSEAVEVERGRILDLGIDLGGQQHAAIRGERVVDGLHGPVARQKSGSAMYGNTTNWRSGTTGSSAGTRSRSGVAHAGPFDFFRRQLEPQARPATCELRIFRLLDRTVAAPPRIPVALPAVRLPTWSAGGSRRASRTDRFRTRPHAWRSPWASPPRTSAAAAAARSAPPSSSAAADGSSRSA
jgi:hypothetical protein